MLRAWKVWNAKPRVVQQLTLVWALFALQSLIFGAILAAFEGDDDFMGAGVFFVLWGVLFSVAHYQVSPVGRFFGAFLSFGGACYAGWLSIEVIQLLITFLKLGHLNVGTDNFFSYDYAQVTLPRLVMTTCAMISSFVLALAAFVLALSRPARLAYGSKKGGEQA